MFSRLFFGGGIFLRPTAEAPELIHTEDTSNDADLGLENTKKNNITFKPPYSRKTAILSGLRKFSAENSFTMRDATCKLPLIVIVAT